MQPLKIGNDTFYVDDVTRELSQKYDTHTYKAPFNTIGEGATEGVLGRFFFISRMVGEFVGVDFATYSKKFPNEQWYDNADIFDEDGLEACMSVAEEEGVVPPVLRIEKIGDKKIYVPTENLIRVMTKGTNFVPFEQWFGQQSKPH